MAFVHRHSAATDEGARRETYLETNTGDITDGVAATAETGDQNLVVLLDEVQATIAGHEGGDLLAVLNQTHTHALSDSGVRLLGLNTTAAGNNHHQHTATFTRQSHTATYRRSRTIPLAIEAPPKGFAFMAVSEWLLLKDWHAQAHRSHHFHPACSTANTLTPAAATTQRVLARRHRTQQATRARTFWAQRWLRRVMRSLRAAFMPAGFL